MNRPLLAIAVGLLTASGFCQVKRALTVTDYGQWQSMVAQSISADGRWFACQIGLVDGDGWMEVRNVDGAQKADVPLGARGAFSDDSRWFACLVGVPKKEADALQGAHKPIPTVLSLRDLGSSMELRLDSVANFEFLKGGQFLVVSRQRTEPSPGPADLYVMNLKTGANLTIGNVEGYSANKAGNLLALRVAGSSGESGVQLFDPVTSSIKTIVWGKSKIDATTWSDNGDALAFLSATKSEKKDGDWNALYLATNLRSEQVRLVGFATEPGKDLPAGTRIAEFGGFSVNADASIVQFGIRPWADAKKPPANPADVAGVDVWSSHDIRIQPLQQRQAQLDMHRVEPCVWRPATGAMVRLSDDVYRSVSVVKGGAHAVELDEKPYQSPVTNGFDYYDLVAIDTATGARTTVATKLHEPPVGSPEGRYLTFYKDKNWSIYDFATGKATEVTKGMGAAFEDASDDHTVPEKPSYQGPSWLAKDSGAVFYEDRDAFLWTPASPKLADVNLTKDHSLRFRLIDPGDNEDGVALDKPMYFSLFDPVTKQSGFYLRQADGSGKTLILDDKMFSNMQKAKQADRAIFDIQSFEDSPNAYVTNSAFTQAKPITHTNPRQAKFLWGHSELIKYKSRAGDALEGELVYPADYQKGRKYPMVTYIYEKLSDNLHRYSNPVDYASYNVQAFSQNGYFVLMPDIVYHGTQPGLSAQGCIEPAVAEAIKVADVDPAHVGLVGHSWGAYQTAFMSTKSKAFAAYAAGAPLTDLISMYGSIYWNSGTPDQEILETSQGRLRVPFWQDLKTYMDNSPIFHVESNTAPLLMAFGTADGAVDWHQGQEMYIDMRRAGKNVSMLVYEGENHSLARRPNQLDYAHRVRHFFDVYLKGAKPEPWLTTGVPFLQKD